MNGVDDFDVRPRRGELAKRLADTFERCAKILATVRGHEQNAAAGEIESAQHGVTKCVVPLDGHQESVDRRFPGHKDSGSGKALCEEMAPRELGGRTAASQDCR